MDPVPRRREGGGIHSMHLSGICAPEDGIGRIDDLQQR
jgi:hypothetical protein